MRGRGEGQRQGGRRTIRGRGNGRSSRTVLTGHKYAEAGKVNGHRLRRERLHGGREAHFTTSDAGTAILSASRRCAYVCGCVCVGGIKQVVGQKGEGVGGGGRSHQGKWNDGMSRMSSRVRVGVGAPTAH